MYLVVDKSNIHNVSNIEQALHNGGYTELKEVLIIPIQGEIIRYSTNGKKE
jgi:hypothetical protein